MSSIVVRRATLADKNWVVEQVKEFQKFMGDFIPFNKPAVEQLVEVFITHHHMLIADRGGEKCGFVAAMVQPHFLNPDVKVMSEIAWWVPTTHRHTRAGLLLFSALDELATTLGVDVSVVAVEGNSPLTGRVFAKRGYKVQEISLMRTKQCPQ